MYSVGEFAKLIGVSKSTLRRWHVEGKLIPDTLESGHRRYTETHLHQIKGINSNRINVLYSRESTKQQESSLLRQEQQLKDFCIGAGIIIHKSIKEYGSGMNFKRKGLIELINLISSKSIGKLVIFHKDRLVRFGFELIKELCVIHGTELIIVDNIEEEKTKQHEFAEDLISIIHYFSMRLYGSRSYKNKIKDQIEND